MARLRIDTVGRVSTYVCEDLDAGLPLHAHPPGSGQEHDIRCDAGRIKVVIHPLEVRELGPGERLEFDSSRWHGVAPLTIGAAFTNTAALEQPEFHSVLDSPHKLKD